MSYYDDMNITIVDKTTGVINTVGERAFTKYVGGQSDIMAAMEFQSELKKYDRGNGFIGNPDEAALAYIESMETTPRQKSDKQMNKDTIAGSLATKILLKEMGIVIPEEKDNKVEEIIISRRPSTDIDWTI